MVRRASRLPSLETIPKQIDCLGERAHPVCPGTRYRGRLPGDADATTHGTCWRAPSTAAPRALFPGHPAVESQLADDHGSPHNRDIPARSEDPKGDRQVVIGATLREVGRGQIHRDGAVGEAETRRCHRGPDPILGLAHCGVGQPGQLEDIVLTPDVGLDLDRSDLSPDERHRSRGCVHGREGTEPPETNARGTTVRPTPGT